MNGSRAYAGCDFKSNVFSGHGIITTDVALNDNRASRRFSVHDRRHSRHAACNAMKNLIALICIAILISVFSIILVKGSSTVDQGTLNKYYKSITIESNDTLWNIADMYNDGKEAKDSYINTIKQLNNMSSDTLYAGESLIVYYYSDTSK